jgi:hypothetical protein
MLDFLSPINSDLLCCCEEEEETKLWLAVEATKGNMLLVWGVTAEYLVFWSI